jgi:integrase
MPSCKLTKRAIDALPPPASQDQIWWDEDLKGFGLKLTPTGRKVFLVQYRPAGDRRNPRKYTIGEYGSVTPHKARIEAQGCWPIAPPAVILKNLRTAARTRFAMMGEPRSRMRSRRAITSRLRTSPTVRITAPAGEQARHRVLSDEELAHVVKAARQIGFPFGSIVEVLTLTGQRRDEVGRMRWDHLDLRRKVWIIPGEHAQNGKPHLVQLSGPVLSILDAVPKTGDLVFSGDGQTVFQGYSKAKTRLDHLSGVEDWTLHDLRRTVVSGMARLGVAPHVADKILNHQSGTISGVAAVYQRHEFLKERERALQLWGKHVQSLLISIFEGTSR